MERDSDPTDCRRAFSLSSSSSSSSSSSDSESSTVSASSSIASFSSSSSDDSGRHGSRNRSNKKRRPSRERARTRSNKRRSSDKDLKQKRGKDQFSRYDRGKPLKKKTKRLHNSDGNCEISLPRSQKKILKQKKRKGTKRHRSEKQSDSRADKKRIGKSADCYDEIHLHKRTSKTSLQLTMELQEQQKALIRHSAEIAKAKLASGELQRARDEQIKMQQLYGSVDWRAKKRLRTEKKILERTVAAGNKLATFEQRENARMDAFRAALGLPTVEAQRQAEWRAEATQALIELESQSNHGSSTAAKTAPKGFIGPALPP